MGKRIYVGNIPFSCTEELLEQLFGAHGAVESVKIITDRETGRSRGFAFVEMEDAGADAAIQALDGKDMDGRPMRVNEARERERRGGGGRGGPRRH
jgi:RNA recognition motif-containing protein